MSMHPAAPIALTAFAAILFSSCEGMDGPEPPLEGAWSIVSISVSGPDSAANTMVQPSIYLFGDTHYSMMRVTGNQPRTLAATDSVTDAEKLAAHDSYIANSGTYETADSTLTTHPVVARSPNFMSGGSDKFTFRVRGDTMWLTNSSADLKSMIGGQLVSPSGPPSTTRLVLVRQQ